MKKESTKTIAAIDVGTSKVCTVIAEVEQTGDFQITGIGLAENEGMKKGLVIDMDSVTQSVYESLGEAEKQAGIVVGSAYVNIAGSHVAANSKRGTATVTDPNRGVSPEDVRRCIDDARNLLLPPDKQVIDVMDLEYTLDGQSGILEPIGMSGTHLEVIVQIMTGAVAFVQNLTKSVMKVGIQLDGVIYTPMAAGEAVLNSDEKQIGIILLDIGAGTTDVALFAGGHVSSAWTVPVGGNHIDNDIAVRFGISHAEAERVKIEHGRAFLEGVDESMPVEMRHVGGKDKTQVPKGMVCQVIEPRVSELLDIVRDGIHENVPGSILPAGVVVTGGTAQLEGFLYMAEQLLELNTRLGLPMYEGNMSESVKDPTFSTAMGLVEYAVKHSPRKSMKYGNSGGSVSGMFSAVSNFIKGIFLK